MIVLITIYQFIKPFLDKNGAFKDTNILLLRPHLGLSKSDLISGMVLILKIK